MPDFPNRVHNAFVAGYGNSYELSGRRWREKKDPCTGTITPREQQVIDLVVEGYENSQIGLHLEIGTETVKEHLRRAFRKLRVMSRAELIVKVLSEHYAGEIARYEVEIARLRAEILRLTDSADSRYQLGRGTPHAQETASPAARPGIEPGGPNR